MSPRLRALLASLRIANAPSVVSHVVLGWMLRGILGDGYRGSFPELGVLILIGLCLLFAGNLLNDWFDREWDRRHRPERAIPSGLLPAPAFLVAAIALGTVALVLASGLGASTIAITIAILLLIVVYTWIHKRSRWAILVMGLCRGGLYPLGASTAGFAWLGGGETFAYVHPFAFWIRIALGASLILGLAAYVAGLSLCARFESLPDPPRGPLLIARLLLFSPALLFTWSWSGASLSTLVGVTPFLAWTIFALVRKRRTLAALVSALLAGLPLVDFIRLAPLAATYLPSLIQSPNPLPWMLVTLTPLLAFALGLLLQRLAPAT